MSSDWFNRNVFADRRTHPIYWIALTIVFLELDYLADPFIQFPILFLIPVTLASHYTGGLCGVVLAIGMPILRFFLDELPGSTRMDAEVLNTILNTLVLTGFAVLVDMNAQQRRSLEQRLRILSGLLPICSYCKRIRDEKQEWQELEGYITARSEASFSHSLCPECLQKHYPDISKS